jgi:oxygen-independent coproporphyrinogen-3 oxidase
LAGIYIHIPFCKQACNYCNFHFSTSLKHKDALIAAIVKEIALTQTAVRPDGRKEAIETVYFGGGTPSILTSQDLHKILDALKDKFLVDPAAEITLEANPDDISPPKLQQWLEAGFNRLSVGIQSFSAAELVWMNRAHTAADSLRCIDEIKRAGFSDFSVDLIYGSPLLSNAEWERNVSTVIAKAVPHISCYALTVEPKTALAKMVAEQQKAGTDPALQAAQFLLLSDWMAEAGYEHYEISNFALPGRRSKHNSSYWQGKKYYGFGPSAHAFNGAKRSWNIANNALYIRSLDAGNLPFEEELLTPTQQLNEYIMTGLRTVEGVDLDRVAIEFGTEKASQLKVAADKYRTTGKLLENRNKLVLTREGKLFADGIAADLFFED